MKTHLLRGIFIPLFLVTTSCAENAAIVDIGKGVSEKSAEAMRGAGAFYQDLEVRRRKAAAVVVASDPSCLPTSLTLQLQGPKRPRGRQGPLCRTDGLAAGHMPYDLDFSPTAEAVLKPRLMLIAAIADYGKALGKVAADPEADISGELDDFVKKVDRVGTFLSLISGESLTTLASVRKDPKAVAIENLLVFANTLAHQAEQARKIRDLVRTDGDRVDAAIDALSADLDLWQRPELKSIAHERRAALERAYENGRRRMSFSERQATAEAVYEAQADEERAGDAADKVLTALSEMKEAQKELRGAVVGQFSEKRKRETARQNLDRLTRALELIASLGTAFI